MEQQAFGRVYRMGQQKETHFGRMMVKNTVDERLADLQVQKLQLIARTIKDHDSSKVTITAEEIASLLGRVVRDEEGNFVDILPDYDDDDESDGGVNEGRWEEDGYGSDNDSQYCSISQYSASECPTSKYADPEHAEPEQADPRHTASEDGSDESSEDWSDESSESGFS